jgi:hypothetical protein
VLLKVVRVSELAREHGRALHPRLLAKLTIEIEEETAIEVCLGNVPDIPMFTAGHVLKQGSASATT